MAWANAFAGNPLFNPAEVFMENAFLPYLGTNKSSSSGILGLSGKDPKPACTTCPSAINELVPMTDEAVDSGDYGFDTGFYYNNDGVTYPFMVTYNYYKASDLEGYNGNNITHPITNRRTTDVYNASIGRARLGNPLSQCAGTCRTTLA